MASTAIADVPLEGSEDQMEAVGPPKVSRYSSMLELLVDRTLSDHKLNEGIKSTTIDLKDQNSWL